MHVCTYLANFCAGHLFCLGLLSQVLGEVFQQLLMTYGLLPHLGRPVLGFLPNGVLVHLFAPIPDVDIQGIFVLYEVSEMLAKGLNSLFPTALRWREPMILSKLFPKVLIMVASWKPSGGVIKSSKEIPQ